MAKSIQDILALIKEKDINMVDFKMVDINGQYRHVTIPAENFLILYHTLQVSSAYGPLAQLVRATGS